MVLEKSDFLARCPDDCAVCDGVRTAKFLMIQSKPNLAQKRFPQRCVYFITYHLVIHMEGGPPHTGVPWEFCFNFTAQTPPLQSLGLEFSEGPWPGSFLKLSRWL